MFYYEKYVLVLCQTTGELKRSTVHQVNQYLRSTDEYDNDMMSNNLIPVSQQNGICETQLHFSNQCE